MLYSEISCISVIPLLVPFCTLLILEAFVLIPPGFGTITHMLAHVSYLFHKFPFISLDSLLLSILDYGLACLLVGYGRRHYYLRNYVMTNWHQSLGFTGVLVQELIV